MLDPETARIAMLSGAEFIVTPVVRPAVIEMCRRYDKAVMPGADADRDSHGLGSRRRHCQSLSLRAGGPGLF